MLIDWTLQSLPPNKTKQNKHTNRNPKCKSIKHPSLPLCPENETQAQALQPGLHSVQSGPSRPLRITSPQTCFPSPELLTIPLMLQAVLFFSLLPAPCPLPGMPFSESASGQHLRILWRCCYPLQEPCILIAHAYACLPAPIRL